jgi:hypothetical protein
MEIKRSGSQPSGKGPTDYFTGSVRIDPLFQAPDPARVRGASVTFEPGARTAWHTHPLGQTLIITAGCGWVQRLVLPEREALARRYRNHRHDPYLPAGSPRRQGRRLDGKSFRRAIPAVTGAKRTPPHWEQK